ncbi:MAG: T9SS type A sorting domain-containing protein [Bacteroidota bacterium]
MKKLYSLIVSACVSLAAYGQCSITISSQVNVSCFGNCTGSANTTVSGFVPAPTYSWSTTPAQTTANATGLCAGTYTVTATNGVCTQTATVTITEPSAALSATTTQTNVSCFGGSDGTATVTAAGGTSPYTYTWNSTPSQSTQMATGLSAGTYACTVTDANGCVTSVAVTITQPASAVAATATGSPVSCNGGSNGSATATASGGTPSYTYSWAPGGQTSANATGLTAGTYTCTVSDANGCTATATVTVTQPAPLAANLTVTNVSCFGLCDGVAMSNTSGGTAPYSYSWSSGATTAIDSGLCAGAHSVLIVDANNCAATQAFTVTQPAALIVVATGTNATCVGCTNGSATANATGGTGPYTYLWTPGNQTTQTAAGLGMGNYVVCVTDVNGCSDCDTVFINDGTAVTYYENIYNITVFPNPTSGDIEVEMDPLSATEIRFVLSDVLGNAIHTEKVFASSVFRKGFHTSELPAGIYFLRTEIDGKTITQRVIKY